MTCPVCGQNHRPFRLTNGGPARCYHCGHTAARCRCAGPAGPSLTFVGALLWLLAWAALIGIPLAMLLREGR